MTTEEKRIPEIQSAAFTSENSADNNRVFLYESHSEPPFVGPVSGWKIVGYGRAPWPKADSDFAVMFEKTTPAENYGGSKGEEMTEGSRIWMHYKEEWIVPSMTSHDPA